MNERIIANPIWLTDSSGLEIVVRSLLAVTVDVDVQIYGDVNEKDETDEQRIKPLRLSCTPTAIDGSANSFFIPVKRGNLVGVALSTATAAVRHGDCYCTINLRTFPNANAPLFGSLARGYVTTTSPVIYPGTNEGSSDGDGDFTELNIGAQGVGSNFNATVPVNQLWLLVGCKFTFVASAAAANRFIVIITQSGFDNNWNILLSPVVASETIIASFFNGASNGRNAVTPFLATAPIALTKLPPGGAIVSGIQNLQGGDQITALGIAYYRWIVA